MFWIFGYLALGFFFGIATCIRAVNTETFKNYSLSHYLFLFGFCMVGWPGILLYGLID